MEKILIAYGVLAEIVSKVARSPDDDFSDIKAGVLQSDTLVAPRL